MTENTMVFLLLAGPPALIWLLWGLDWVLHAGTVKELRDVRGEPSQASPSVSVVFSALNEQAEVERASLSFLSQEGVSLDVVAVNDRSTDQTGSLLDNLGQRDPRLHPVHIKELPEGWLGKTHALFRGAQKAKGDWILFTDADVTLAPDVLQKAIRHAEEEGLDHLVVFPDLGRRSFPEEIFLSGFLVISSGAVRPWKVQDPHSKDALGIGAFNLIQKKTYDDIGGHKELRLEVVDDIELGRRVKKKGYSSGVLSGQKSVFVDWHRGLPSLFGGMEKNFFGAFHFNTPAAVIGLTGLFILAWSPWICLFSGVSLGLWAGGIGLAGQAAVFFSSRRLQPARWWTVFFVPLGFTFLGLTLLRSILKTHLSGGITWRGTYYPLSLLARNRKKGWLALLGRY